MTQVREGEETQDIIFNQLTEYSHEQLVFCQDKDTGLKAIIAIHNTWLGPGLGGTRMYNYATDREAITDVLRLSRGMTYKAAIAGLNLGGAKAVIIGDPRTQKTEALMRRFGRFVDSLSGRYITAEDVGTTTKDMEFVAMETDHAVGLPEAFGGGGDPSPMTALGTYLGMKACAQERWGSDSLTGKKVLVEGVGKVGRHLVEMLANEQANILVADVQKETLDWAVKEFGAEVVKLNEVPAADVDIYAPCALGATLNDKTIPQLKATIVAGAANNQLQEEKKHGQMLLERDIIYAPDYLINSGGLINVYTELNGYNAAQARANVERIYDQMLEILQTSSSQKIPTYQAANKVAEQRVEGIGRVKLPY